MANKEQITERASRTTFVVVIIIIITLNVITTLELLGSVH